MLNQIDQKNEADTKALVTAVRSAIPGSIYLPGICCVQSSVTLYATAAAIKSSGDRARSSAGSFSSAVVFR